MLFTCFLFGVFAVEKQVSSCIRVIFSYQSRKIFWLESSANQAIYLREVCFIAEVSVVVCFFVWWGFFNLIQGNKVLLVFVAFKA